MFPTLPSLFRTGLALVFSLLAACSSSSSSLFRVLLNCLSEIRVVLFTKRLLHNSSSPVLRELFLFPRNSPVHCNEVAHVSEVLPSIWSRLCSCFSSSPVPVERFSDSASLGLFERFATGCHLSQTPHSYSDGFLLLCRNAHRRALCSRFSASLVLAELFPVKRLLGCPSGLLSLSNSLVTLTPQNFARPTTFVTP